MKYPSARILVFAKAPVPGQVKTRLLPALSATEAANLHTELVHRTLAMATELSLCPVELWCAPTPAHPFFAHCRQTYRIELHQQCEGDVGQRMEHALRTTLQKSESAMIIGSDCPVLTCADLGHALELLNQNKQQTTEAMQVILGPAEDGGYVLIGARHCHPSLFKDIEWGTDKVLATTRQRLQTLTWNWGETRTLWDLDRPEDWLRYQKEERKIKRLRLSAS